MHQMSALEYSFIVGELAPRVVGKHFSRIRKLGENIYRMKIGTSEIVCELGVRIHETRYVEEAVEGDKFAEKANKELDNAKLLSLEQLNNDRIVSFVFDRGSLVFEMFGDGNAILVRDGKTVCAAKYERWAGREITAGKPYQPPASAPSARLETSDRYIIVSLMKVPFGKEYALEALARAGIDEKKPGNQLSEAEIRRLEAELAGIRESARPFVFYGADGKPIDFALAPLAKHSKLKTQEFKTISEAADEYYQNAERQNPELLKLQARLEKQKERLKELGAEEKEARAAGDYIYAHYQEAERLIALARAGKSGEIEKQYRGKMDKKEKSVEAEL